MGGERKDIIFKKKRENNKERNKERKQFWKFRVNRKC